MAYLSKREQQIIELVYERESLTAAEAEELLPGQPSNSTVRTLLRILEEKGQLSHRVEEGKFIYSAVKPRHSAAKQALESLVRTFYKGSVSDVVAALLTEDAANMSDEELEALQAMIQRAREDGR